MIRWFTMLWKVWTSLAKIRECFWIHLPEEHLNEARRCGLRATPHASFYQVGKRCVIVGALSNLLTGPYIAFKVTAKNSNVRD